MLVPLENLPVFLAEHLRADRLLDRVLHLVLGRPDVARIDRLAVLVVADRVGLKVDVHRAGQGIGDDQGGRGEVVGPDLGVDPPLEIAVARSGRRR